MKMATPLHTHRTLHPSEHRGYRELYAAAQQIVSHWGRLAQWFSEDDIGQSLADGVIGADDLLQALEAMAPVYGLHGAPAAKGAGGQIAAVRTLVTDRFLERNQALRAAVLDAQHLSTLLSYLNMLAEAEADDRLANFCQDWRERFAEIEAAVWLAAVHCGDDRESAIKPADPSLVGRAAHVAAYTFGAMGEMIDRAAAALPRHRDDRQ